MRLVFTVSYLAPTFSDFLNKQIVLSLGRTVPLIHVVMLQCTLTVPIYLRLNKSQQHKNPKNVKQ